MKLITVSTLALATLGAVGCDYDDDYPTGQNGQPDSTYSLPRAAGLVAPTGRTRTGFGFNGTVSGAPTGAVFLTGGGSFDPATATDVVPGETAAASAGGFRCVSAVAQGPLAGCGAGEGVRWKALQLLATTTFRCTGADSTKSAATGEGIVVLLADFYRAGDGNEQSFTARIIVSRFDIAADLPGSQTLWVQGVGCTDAQVSFSR